LIRSIRTSPDVRRPKAALLLGALVTAVALLGTLSSSAWAGVDTFSCSSTLGRPCTSPYQHHSKYVIAEYRGSGSLPLLAGSYCQEAGCGGGYIFYQRSGDYNPPIYNYLVACYTNCSVNSGWLGRAHAENRNTSTHTVWGEDGF
jgi:hypothetical protein